MTRPPSASRTRPKRTCCVRAPARETVTGRVDRVKSVRAHVLLPHESSRTAARDWCGGRARAFVASLRRVQAPVPTSPSVSESEIVAVTPRFLVRLWLYTMAISLPARPLSSRSVHAHASLRARSHVYRYGSGASGAQQLHSGGPTWRARHPSARGATGASGAKAWAGVRPGHTVRPRLDGRLRRKGVGGRSARPHVRPRLDGRLRRIGVRGHSGPAAMCARGSTGASGAKACGGTRARPHCAPAARRAPPAQRRGRAFGPGRTVRPPRAHGLNLQPSPAQRASGPGRHRSRRGSTPTGRRPRAAASVPDVHGPDRPAPGARRARDPSRRCCRGRRDRAARSAARAV